MPKETWKDIAARIYKNAPRSVKNGETIMHLPPLVAGPSGRQKTTWAIQSHEAKLQRLAKESRENPSFLSTNELKPKNFK